MLQDARASASDPAVICSFDYEAIDRPTRAIIHQAARFLYVKCGRGKLVIDGEEYVLQPNTLVAITPWKITDTVEVTDAAALVINGSTVAEPDIYEETPKYDSNVTYPLTLADGEYFILCDARAGARDSRWFGPVQAGEIQGRVIAVLRRNGI